MEKVTIPPAQASIGPEERDECGNHQKSSRERIRSHYFSRAARAARARQQEERACSALKTLVDQQYELARQYPGEYVLVDGTTVLFHSPHRSEALEAYRHLAAEGSAVDLRLIRPDAPSPPPESMFRGRSASSD